ncbi:MAG: Clp protease ClpP [Synergistaceae bacterium]|nr:Clp protease ClpP [Synergistaceae bacterium]MBQ3653465.1 Clp protease ClpP [Synergistaceae bacterium]
MYKIQDVNGSTEILLYSLIYDGLTGNQILRRIPPEGPITLRINSDGGDVFEAIGLYNYLKDREVYVVVDGLCASAASVLAMCGKRITMRTGAMMMLHQPLSAVCGNAEEFREAAGVLDKIGEGIAGIYASRTKMSVDDVKALMNASTWLTAGECLVYGLCDELESAEPPAEEPPAKTYEDGVHDERQRLYALDELAGPGRENILKLAKYKDILTARDVAVEILKIESVRPPVVSASVPGGYGGAVEMMIKHINEKRGIRA